MMTGMAGGPKANAGSPAGPSPEGKAQMAGREADRSADLAAELAKRDMELGPVLGRGAMAVVYRAFDNRHERSLAVKVLDLDPADKDGAARWAREISAVARLRHPNIVPLIDSGTTANGTAYFLMPLAEGETLKAHLERGPLPIPEAVRYAREIGEALAYAHAQGVLHRDVKPDNILLEGGHAVLADFGLTRPLRPAVYAAGHQTQIDMVVGTPAYMSPEQLTAGGGADGRSDLFGLGVVLYEMLTGRVPFGSTTMPGLMTERLNGSYGAVAALRPGVPLLLQQVIARALAPDPEARYDGAESMVADLNLVERQLSGAAMAPPPPPPPPRRMVPWMVGGLAALGALAAALWWRRPAVPGLDPNRIVVADMRNETGDSSVAPIGALASDVISAGLTGIPGLTVINSDLVFGAARRNTDRRIAGSPAQELRALVNSTRAATVVSGSYYRESGRLEVFTEITDAATGRVLLDLGPLRGSTARPDSVLAEARDSVTAFIQARRGRRVS
jgi:serine/threonine protein kinase